MRRLIAVPCAGETLAATLDDAAGETGLLIVSGGNEIRGGAHRGMAMLAARLAAGGTPVFRFDRRGVGDSGGINTGYAGSAADISAAAAAFRAEAPLMRRVVGFGNCDAASALALFHRQAGIDALILANPWIGGEADALPAPAAIRARYADRLRDPVAWRRLLRGGVDLRKLGAGLLKAARRPAPPALATAMAAALGATPLTLLLATRDPTAIAFRQAWDGRAFAAARARATRIDIPTASHSFAHGRDPEALAQAIVAVL